MPSNLAEQVLKKFYNAIRKGFGTLEAFYNDADKNKNGQLTIQEFSNAAGGLKVKAGLELNSNEMNAIFKKICPQERNILYFMDFSNGFQSYLEIDLKDVIYLIDNIVNSY